jgi:hypothetical protein
MGWGLVYTAAADFIEAVLRLWASRRGSYFVLMGRRSRATAFTYLNIFAPAITTNVMKGNAEQNRAMSTANLVIPHPIPSPTRPAENRLSRPAFTTSNLRNFGGGLWRAALARAPLQVE